MTDVHLMLGRDLDTDGVIAKNAQGYVPVEVALDVAIEAHRRDANPMALRAVVLAAADTPPDRHARLRYLDSLCEEAWRGYDPEPAHPPHQLRDATLTTLRRAAQVLPGTQPPSSCKCAPSKVEKLLALCREIVPSGLPNDLAIAAHREAVARRLDDGTQAFAIGTVVLAATPALEDSQKQLDCLAAIPGDRWPPLPDICGGDREACLAAIRRTIGWHLSGGCRLAPASPQAFVIIEEGAESEPFWHQVEAASRSSGSYRGPGWTEVFEPGGITPVFVVLDRLPVGLSGAARPGPSLLLPPTVPIGFAIVPWFKEL